MKQLFLISLLALLCQCNKSDIPIDKNLQVLIDSPNEIRGSSFAIINVNVIPMTSNVILFGQTVIIKNNIIDWIGPSDQANISNQNEIIDAMNLGFLMPGLTDMHFHRSTIKDLFLFVANGVTIVREMWGSTGMVKLRDQILDEKMDLPQVFVASPGMNGANGAFEAFTPPVTSIEQAKNLVQQYKKEGFDFIKVYNKLEPEIYAAIIDESKLQNINVVGHVPKKVEPEVVFRSGQSTTEHLIGFGYFASSKNTIEDGILDPNKVAELAKISVDNNVWHVPTIDVDSHTKEAIDLIKQSKNYQYISDNLKTNFDDGFHQGTSTAMQSEINHKEALMALKQADSKLLLGTDSGFGYIIPGFSIHDELAHYVDAGFSNYEALETVTINPALHLGLEQSVGTIEIGKRADLILLESNPLENISNLKDKAGVVLRGTWLSEKLIQEKLNSE